MSTWLKLIDQHNIEYQHSVDYRFMITFRNGMGRRVNNRGEAYLSLQEEKEKWKVYQQLCVKRGVPCGDDQQALPSAFGFWLFPIDAFGPVPPTTEGESENGAVDVEPFTYREDRCLDREWDLSESRPKRCLQHLPEAPRYVFDLSDSLEKKHKSQQQPSLSACPSKKEFYPVDSYTLKALREVEDC